MNSEAFDKLMGAWRASGGTLLELLEELETDRGRELAQAYGLSDEDVADIIVEESRRDGAALCPHCGKPLAET